jgi:hypothetical protein
VLVDGVLEPRHPSDTDHGLRAPHGQSIDICICTFRRDSVADTIASVRRQAIPEGVAAPHHRGGQ